MQRSIGTAVAVALLFSSSALIADEGMWTFDNFPADRVNAQLGTSIDQDWLDKVRNGTIRLANCTASFVSPEGLILTNHHCAASCLAQHSSRNSSLLESGFLARRNQDELRCETQIADVLIGMEDITAHILTATAGLNDQVANEARKRMLTQLEQSCEEDARATFPNELRKCEAVTLYDGGQYFIYTYRRYDDVRLVFAPEAAIAAFGGDPDNFQFPRWCLDMAFLRAYEDNQVAYTPNHLTLNFSGPNSGDAVFVAGHPGSTDRQLTVEQLRTIRDTDLPPALLRAAELRGRYIQFGTLGEQQARIVAEPLFALENGIKVRRKRLDALHDDVMMNAKAQSDTALRDWLANDPELSSELGDPWARIAAAQQTQRAISLPYTLLEAGAAFNSRLFRYARILVRGAAERSKPNTDRLQEYADAALPRLTQQLAAEVPIYPELEKLTLAFSLERMREWLGPDHAIVRQLLSEQSPRQLAETLVDGTTLADPAERMRLWESNFEGLAQSTDPMIQLSIAVDEAARTIRTRYEDDVEAPVDSATAAIAQARFAAYGTKLYPDATFTLRLNFGSVVGWSENGDWISPITRLDRLYERKNGTAPFALPQRWIDHADRLDMDTPFNVSTTNDIVGGNSGSPLINANGEIVGLLFDGNIHSISGTYWFDEQRNRAIAVHSAIMLEALDTIYEADELLQEVSRVN